MDKKRERIIWISITSGLLVLITVILLSPVASAQSLTRDESHDYIKELETVLHAIKTYYVDTIDTKTLFDGAMNGMFATLDDPYSVYLDDNFLQKMTDTTKGKYGGVGLYISQDRFDPEKPYGRLPYVKIVAPIEDTPGWKAGINAGDYIYAIEDKSAEGFSSQEVADRLRGTPGSDVTITILRSSNIIFDVVLTREIIEIPTTKTTVINNEIGYLRIIEFTPFTQQRVERSLEKFSTLGLEQLIIDVRNNPGGLLDSVVKIADLFFTDGVVVSTKFRQEGQNHVHRAGPGKMVPRDMDVVILIDRGSASASEILTGALKDRGRATVIGETSFGKGSVQQILPLQNKDVAIKLTTGRYYTPNGSNIDKVGITPDIIVEEPELTEEETQALATILQENRIGMFIRKNPNPTKKQVNQFIKTLHDDGLALGDQRIRLMVKRESGRRLNIPPVVDLEYDRTLIRAIKFLRIGQ